MGEGNFGGDGSVKWDVTVDQEGAFRPGNPNPGGRHTCDGTDVRHGPGFTVRVKPPRGTSPQQFLDQLRNGGMRVVGGRVEFTVGVEDTPVGQGTPQQVQIEW